MNICHKKKIILALSILIVSAIVIYGRNYIGSNKNNETIIYPIINEKVVGELENGHHTGYFSCESVLYGYLSKTYPNQEFKVIEENLGNKDYKKYTIRFQGTNKQIDVFLKETYIKTNNGTLRIWGIVKR